MNQDKSNVISTLESKKSITARRVEYWRARDLQQVLGYQRWDRFVEVIQRAMLACESAGMAPENHFSRTGSMVDIGSGARREVEDYYLTRYACYLVAMNGDTGKTEVGIAQTYFAEQTRRQEIQDQLTDDQKRVLLRERVKNANRALSSVAKQAGVRNFGVFHDAGYRGLYGGLGNSEIKRNKRIPEKEDLLDCAGRAELAANEFRITQAEQKLSRDQVRGEGAAVNTHHEVGKHVRETIRRIGGTMPEELPPEPSIKKLIAPRKRKAITAPESREDRGSS